MSRAQVMPLLSGVVRRGTQISDPKHLFPSLTHISFRYPRPVYFGACCRYRSDAGLLEDVLMVIVFSGIPVGS